MPVLLSRLLCVVYGHERVHVESGQQIARLHDADIRSCRIGGGSRDVSYTFFDVQKDDSYNERLRVERSGRNSVCGTAVV